MKTNHRKQITKTNKRNKYSNVLHLGQIQSIETGEGEAHKNIGYRLVKICHRIFSNYTSRIIVTITSNQTTSCCTPLMVTGGAGETRYVISGIVHMQSLLLRSTPAPEMNFVAPAVFSSQTTFTMAADVYSLRIIVTITSNQTTSCCTPPMVTGGNGEPRYVISGIVHMQSLLLRSTPSQKWSL